MEALIYLLIVTAAVGALVMTYINSRKEEPLVGPKEDSSKLEDLGDLTEPEPYDINFNRLHTNSEEYNGGSSQFLEDAIKHPERDKDLPEGLRFIVQMKRKEETREDV